MKLWAKLSVWWCPACDFSREFQRVLGAKQWRNKNSIYGIYGLLLEPLTQLSRLLLAFLCEHRLLIHCTCRLCHLSALHENTQQLHALKAILNVERGLTMAAKQEALFCWLWCALDLPPFSRLNWNLWIHGKMFANFANFQWKPRCWTAGYPVQASSSKPRQLPGSEGLERGKFWLWPWRALALAQKRLRAPRLRVLQNVAALLLKFCWEELHCKAWPKCCDGINVITRCTSGYDRVLPLGLKRILFERLYQLSPSGKMRLQPNSKAQIYITWLDKI